MALFNEILVGRFNRFAQKFLSMKGGPPLPTLGTDLGITIPLRIYTSELYLMGIDQFGRVATNTANAGASFGIRFRNPVASGIVATFHKLVLWTSVSDSVQLEVGATTVDYVLVENGIPLDPRQGPRAGAVILSATNAATAGASLGANTAIDVRPVSNALNSLNDYFKEESEYISLLPGQAINIIGSIVNSAATANVMWLERALEDSERS